MTDNRLSLLLSDASKVSAAIFGFCVIKALATRPGETGGDWATTSLGLGYLAGSAIFALVFVVSVWPQVKAWKLRPALFWTAMVAITIAGWPASKTFAADGLGSDRLISGAAVLEPGANLEPATTPQERASSALPSANASALKRLGPSTGRCEALHKRYAKSEACFARYRMINRGLRPGAFQHCKQLKDPTAECGPAAAR